VVQQEPADRLEHRERLVAVAQQEPVDRLAQPEHREVVGLLVQVVQVGLVAQPEHLVAVVQQEPADRLEHREHLGLAAHLAQQELPVQVEQAETLSPLPVR
jgi:hypothetical protein